MPRLPLLFLLLIAAASPARAIIPMPQTFAIDFTNPQDAMVSNFFDFWFPPLALYAAYIYGKATKLI